MVNNADNDLSILGMSAQQLATLRGISVSEAESIRKDALTRETLKAQKKSDDDKNKTAIQIANIGKSGSGGGSGGGENKPAAPKATGGGFQMLE